MTQNLYPAANYPDGHPDLSSSLQNLANLLSKLGRHAEAAPFHERAKNMRTRKRPPDHPHDT
jgi:hypothetical protein